MAPLGGGTRHHQPDHRPPHRQLAEDNLGATAVVLTDEDRARLDEVSPPGRAIVPYYQADWGPHRYARF